MDSIHYPVFPIVPLMTEMIRLMTSVTWTDLNSAWAPHPETSVICLAKECPRRSWSSKEEESEYILRKHNKPLMGKVNDIYHWTGCYCPLSVQTIIHKDTKVLEEITSMASSLIVLTYI